jgi:tetratricopeptide (TPR) repeat protein
LRRISESSVFRRIYFPVLVLLIAGCSLEKKSGFNRAMQNLTAHYNILFDANEILRQKQESYALSYVDAYNEILSVYQDTTARSGAPDKDLEEAKVKGNKIINIKEQSHYLGDAYLVLGKAGYLEGNYFDAAEYFSYVVRSFPENKQLSEEALMWKARTLIYLNEMPRAKLSIDSAIQNITKKTRNSTVADIYATKLQYDINIQNYEEGEQMAKLAIQHCGTKSHRLRWTFIMAQLQELNNKTPEAYKNYSSIVNSNAAFEMAFNANLNRIRIEQNQNGVKIIRIDRLRSLIKNENNKDFTDQIYYQIAQLYYADKDLNSAIKNYHLSVNYSRKNQNQKGLAYLRLADIYFKDRGDYVAAKKYYDSTLYSLSPGYPGYQTIKKKSDNLQLLADRFSIISREDTLQMLAKLDEKSRSARIDAMVSNAVLQQQQTQAGIDNAIAANTASSGGPQGGAGSSFYFYNSNAVSQGYNDFKRRWGNRKLEDNWRRSNKASSSATVNTAESIDPDAPADQVAKGKTSNAGDYRKQLTQNLPLTPEQLAKSNKLIYDAYFDVANFYRDILGDKKEAITTYELLLSRFPDNTDKSALYYNLYRLYTDDNNQAKAEEYKNLLLKNFPDTPFAKIILDPDYGKKLNDADAGLTELYNQVYDAFSKKDYQQAITLIDNLQKQKPDNKWTAQLSYLRAISAGHLEKLDPFKADLAAIVNKYLNDRLVTPLVKQHLTYLDANRAALLKRPFVLTDKDPNEEPFIPPAVTEAQQAAIRYNNLLADQQAAAVKQAEAAKVVKDPLTGKQINKTSAAEQPNTVQGNPSSAKNEPAKPKPSVFSTRDSTNYYFVVNVGTATVNLASSRFGIGQFNRANLAGSAIRHMLMPVGDNNQLIYIGRFYSLGAVKDYARAIIPLMPDIMKVPKDQYSFFIITQENLDKLNNKSMLDSYIDYYQNNY